MRVTNPHYKFSDAKDATVYEIGIGVVCRNTRFVFDQMVTVRAGESLELDNGQWFLIDKQNERTLLDGKWAL